MLTTASVNRGVALNTAVVLTESIVGGGDDVICTGTVNSDLIYAEGGNDLVHAGGGGCAVLSMKLDRQRYVAWRR